jgi:LysR family glycine cleavage system transcriptional activator
MRLPSLNALRAFEAAARYESFSRAASELCVTEGAISRHIKILEEELGVSLFRRLTRKVELTEQGRQFLPIVGGAFASIAEGAARVSSSTGDLRIIACSTFSIRWLVPRLWRFRSLDAGFQLQLLTKSYSTEELWTSEWDVGLAYGSYGFPDTMKAVPFLPTALTPVCSPQFLEKHKIALPGDLSDLCILHSSKDRYDWKLWAKTYGGPELQVDHGQVYPTRQMAFEVAILGEGAAIGDLTLIQDELAQGTLVTLFPHQVVNSEKESIHVICPKETWADSRTAVFYKWLLGEREAAHSHNPD